MISDDSKQQGPSDPTDLAIVFMLCVVFLPIIAIHALAVMWQ